MENVISLIRSVFITLGVIAQLLPCRFGLTQNKWSPENEDAVLNCVIFSDTHTDGDPFRDRNDKLRKVYTGASSCTAPIDVVLNVGDLTNSGTAKDYRNVRNFDFWMKAENTVVCLGNHDSWNGSDTLDYDTALKNFTNYLAKHDIKTKTAYYAKAVKGVYFICLATERCDHDELTPVYSETQLNWFDETLTEAEKSGMPVFVLSHIPLSGKNGIGRTTLPDEVHDVLLAHSDYEKPILFFSGHYHDFSRNILENEKNFYYINMPSTQYNDEFGSEDERGGLGMTAELCGNKLILRVRNFITGTFVDGYRFEIPC